MKKTKIGIIGCGMISNSYFNASRTFDILELAACADSLPEHAKAKSEEHSIPSMSVKELLANPEIEIVVNLTPPKAHCDVTLDILKAGKHAYVEKPFGIHDEEADRIMAMAREKGLRVGCAPDTFLGGGQQTARKVIDDGWIGKPIAGTAIVMGRGPEKWPQAPFFYDVGAGPMLDLGPYYITALVHLLGPAKSVTAVTCKGSETRTGGPETVPHVYPVNVTTHLTGAIEFHCGAVITVITSFEVFGHTHRPIEIYGSQGSIQVPDPNTFDGPVSVCRFGDDQWKPMPISHIYTENFRSIGVADMAYALQSGRQHRVNGELARHVLEIMLAFDRSSQLGRKLDMTTTCERPAALRLGLEPGQLD